MFRMGVVFMVVAPFALSLASDAAASGKGAGLPGETEVVLNAVRDATIYNDAPTPGEIANGAGQRLFAGRTQSGQLRRALLAFPLDGIPEGATIVDAVLTLTMDKTSNPAAVDFEARRVTAAWSTGASDPPGGADGEGAGTQAVTGDATWIHTSYNSATWSAPGGDFAATASATTPVAGNGAYTWSGAGMIADVQSWLDGGTQNFGWMLLGGEATNGSAKRFHATETPLASARPTLTLRYTVAETGEGEVEGEGEGEGQTEGEGAGEGTPEGEGEGEGEGGPDPSVHNADQDGNGQISLSELLRVIQFYNSTRYGCGVGTEDGYAPNSTDEGCAPHASDYNPQDWRISLSELLRLIQFYNSGGYFYCPLEGTEDDYCPGQP